MSSTVGPVSAKISSTTPRIGAQTAAAAGARARAQAPGDAPVTHASGVVAGRARPLAPEGSDSSANLGRAMGTLSAVSLFGPGFSWLRMGEAHAIAATQVSLRELNSRVAGTLHGFSPRLAFRDELGHVNVRLTRTYDGVPIFGTEVISHLADNGTVRDVTGEPLPTDLALDTKPRVSETAAMTTALASFPGRPEQVNGPTLVVVKTDDGNFHLAHYVNAAAFSDGLGPRRTHFFVDAHSGALLPLTYSDRTGVHPDRTGAVTAKTSKAPTADAAEQQAGLSEGTGNSIFSGTVKLTTTEENGKFILRDPTANNAETRDAHNGAGGSGSQNTIITDNNNKWGEPGDDPRARDGIDAQYAAVMYLKYLKQLFNRDSIDDRGKRLLSNVHVYSNYANAFWDGESMNYGDGDGGDNLSQTDSDTGGHEATHGLTDSTSGLIYRGESGALNEAGSDIIGAAGFSWYMRGALGAGNKRDYLLFEDSYTPNIPDDAIRYMDDPMRDGSSRDNFRTRYQGSADNGGVHWNSGIANNFFFLLAEGGTNRTSGIKVERGIGIEKALRLYYRAHTVYFTPSTTFAQARVAWTKAATDLFGADSPEVKAVAQAASAVGIEATQVRGGVLLS